MGYRNNKHEISKYLFPPRSEEIVYYFFKVTRISSNLNNTTLSSQDSIYKIQENRLIHAAE